MYNVNFPSFWGFFGDKQAKRGYLVVGLGLCQDLDIAVSVY